MRRGQVLFTIFGFSVTLGMVLLALAFLSEVILSYVATSIMMHKMAEFQAFMKSYGLAG